MTPIPVTSSVLSATHLAVIIQEKYTFNQASCEIFRTGINHTYWVMGDGKRYVLRVYSHQWRSKAAIEAELGLLNLLKEHDISVSFPILDAQGDYLQELQAPEGLRYAVLFSFAEGEKIRELTEANCERIGEVMAKIHSVTLNQRVERIVYNSETLVLKPYQYALPYFEADMDEMQFIKAAGTYISTLFERQDAQLRQGVVHLDMWYDNMNIQEDSTVTVFDFDFCGNGWLLLDIAYAIMQLYHTTPDKSQFELNLKAFYRGYESLASISKEEKALLPYAGLAIWIFYLGVQSSRFGDWSNVFLSKNYLKRYIGMVKDWLTYNDVVIEY